MGVPIPKEKCEKSKSKKKMHNNWRCLKKENETQKRENKKTDGVIKI